MASVRHWGDDALDRADRVTALVTALVGAGLAVALGATVGGGLDRVGAVLLIVTGAVGALGIAAARRASTGAIAPRRCPECEGLLSANAPYCKHCGAPRPGDERAARGA
jgi:hypothetical protein